jgi:hypothetical protein
MTGLADDPDLALVVAKGTEHWRHGRRILHRPGPGQPARAVAGDPRRAGRRQHGARGGRGEVQAIETDMLIPQLSAAAGVPYTPVP